MATSSSDKQVPLIPRTVLIVVVLDVLILGAALIGELLAGGGAGAAAVSFALASAAIAIVTIAVFAPRLHRIRAVTEAARAIARGEHEVRAEVTDDDIGAMAAALNASAAHFERLVEQLRGERAQLEALLNASSDATVAVDDQGRVAYLNDAARRLFGTAGPADGRPFIEMVRDHELNELVAAAAQHGERSVRVVPFGMTQRWLQATAVPIEGAAEWAALAVFHDLTEVRRIDSVRRDFVSNVSHELRTPLAAIRAAAETLQEGALDDRPAAREFLGHIQRETDRMTQLVEELLELSRIESGAAPLRFTQVDASTLVQDAVRRFGAQAERAGVTLTAGVNGPLPLIGDGERLERALGNLVANAIKFTPEGGRIEVAAGHEDNDVVISVQDTGIGIEPEQQARVFERFFKTDRGRGTRGTGLGLAIVKHIVQAHGGSVGVESRPGYGSTFTIRLPRR